MAKRKKMMGRREGDGKVVTGGHFVEDMYGRQYSAPSPEYMSAHQEYDRSERDGEMIRNDRSGYANMPQKVLMKSYPYNATWEQDYDDTIGMIDKEIDESVARIKRHRSRSQI